nr:MAG TPA: hypothetical protein [Caudoviricetes sp.]
MKSQLESFGHRNPSTLKIFFNKRVLVGAFYV